MSSSIQTDTNSPRNITSKKSANMFILPLPSSIDQLYCSSLCTSRGAVMEGTTHMREAPLTSMSSEGVSQKNFHYDQAYSYMTRHTRHTHTWSDNGKQYSSCGHNPLWAAMLNHRVPQATTNCLWRCLGGGGHAHLHRRRTGMG